jgi:hypothetical protein
VTDGTVIPATVIGGTVTFGNVTSGIGKSGTETLDADVVVVASSLGALRAG